MGLYEKSQKVLVGTSNSYYCLNGSTYRIYSGICGGTFDLYNFLKVIGRLTKLVIYNTLVLFVLLFFWTLFLEIGKTSRKLRKINHYFLFFIKDKIINYGARFLYDSKQEVPITYSRDENGYGSKEINSKKQIILTIEGSTTDQRCITEGETWQDYLDNALPKTPSPRFI